MAIKVVVARAHEAQLEDPEIKEEYESISSQAYKIESMLSDGSINFAFLKGMYVHSERKMTAVCLFINKLGRPITALRGTIRLKFKDKEAQIAKMTVNFDEDFMGRLNEDEALLVHFNIPVKGLLKDEVFPLSALAVSFEDVRVI